MLIPTGGWVISGDDFDSIRYDEGVAPITRKQFDDGFKVVDKFKADQEAAKEAIRQSKISKLLALGLTQEEIDA